MHYTVYPMYPITWSILQPTDCHCRVATPQKLQELPSLFTHLR